MMTYALVEVKLHAFLISTLYMSGQMHTMAALFLCLLNRRLHGPFGRSVRSGDEKVPVHCGIRTLAGLTLRSCVVIRP
jgi:hypothetical protein